jgi:hypothetical protein
MPTDSAFAQLSVKQRHTENEYSSESVWLAAKYTSEEKEENFVPEFVFKKRHILVRISGVTMISSILRP